MARLYFLLSGEHETLPIAEIKAILEAEGHQYKILETLDQLLRVETDPKCVETVKKRAALTRLCGLELFTCRVKPSQVEKAIKTISLEDFLRKGETFAVRIKHVKTHSSEVDAMALERKLGALILQMVEGAKVNLPSPEKTFTGILTDSKLVFGLKLAEVPSKPFTERRPKKKPFFHPSAMPPKLARCMVNMAKPKTGDLVLDPFSGTGSILIEAALIGCRVLGIDIQRRMAIGSLKNFKHLEIEPEGLIVADAKNPPIRKVDCVVADPPYGKSATTFKRTTKQIIKECLESVYHMVDKGKRICLAAPKNIGVSQIGLATAYMHVESHLVYVHRSLTREIAVFEKV